MSSEVGARSLRRCASVALVVALALASAGCTKSKSKGEPKSSTTPPTAPERHAVGTRTETFVDPSRPTPRSGDKAKLPQRTLKTEIFYPAAGDGSSSTATKDANPDTKSGPYPLIVFSHGLGASPKVYEAVLARWAAAGYVVVAPYFPLTSSETPGGPDAGDVVNQPKDVSFLITAMLVASAGTTGTFAGLIDPEAVGAAGHSNGALTTLGLVANTCCRDDRVKAAVVLAGNPIVFSGGEYDYADAPPLLLVHGTADELLPYDEAVKIFNSAMGPKGLLTVEGGTHGDWLDAKARGFASLMKATTDFFAAYLKADDAARERIPGDATRGETTMNFVEETGAKTTIPTTPKPKSDRHASVTPSTNLTNGQKVTVAWSGFTAGKVVNIVQCAPGPLGSSTPCDLVHGQILKPDPTGEGSLQLEIVAGPVGTGVCDATHKGCLIAVNDGSSQEADATIRIPISFAS